MEEQILRAAALAAFENSEALLEDVECLLGANRYPRALSLSVIGTEELGKSVLYCLAALDLVPGLRVVLAEANRNDPSRDHGFKQLLADMSSVAHFLVQDYVSEFASELPASRADDMWWVDKMLETCAKWLFETRVTKGHKARKEYLEHHEMKREELKLCNVVFPRDQGGTPDEKKFCGLYVDRTNNEVWSPAQVTEVAARREADLLHINLDALWRLKAALKIDEQWHVLSRTQAESEWG